MKVSRNGVLTRLRFVRVGVLRGLVWAVHAGDADHRRVGAVAVQAAIAKEFPCLHACEEVLDASTDLLVCGCAFLQSQRLPLEGHRFRMIKTVPR
ncbi:hypothetical protein GCM10010503_07620 [Streptomyces lucensis JCM 4490]|uniref:Uncharacterized protein n=1 Tax=Streptomyces lucensis JCM 4490 TaxID=1306176 RepID=A0A918IV67_9ACTN|nr:hypothetical protein GCM10010503_07620 [Streptomyces lucensis JCM 4490]